MICPPREVQASCVSHSVAGVWGSVSAYSDIVAMESCRLPVISKPAMLGQRPAPNTWPRLKAGDREPSRVERPLMLLKELSASRGDDAWLPLVVDEDRRCYSFLLPRAVTSEMSSKFLRRLLDVAPWEDLMNPKGTSVTRSTCWYARRGCTCCYTYGRDTKISNGSISPTSLAHGAHGNIPAHGEEEAIVDCSAKTFAEVMDEIMEHVFGRLFPGLSTECWPNCANLNRYSDGRRAVGWHADDESLFKGWDNDCPIVSLSLGTTREFWLALRQEHRGMDADKSSLIEVDLRDGDIMTMEGRMQRHCLHMITKVNPREPLREERVNVTFRWIREHRRYCPLRKKQRSQPHGLRLLFGEAASESEIANNSLQIACSSLFRLGGPYMRSWAREISGELIDASCMDWRLCDGCQHKCYEEGRACCAGQGEYAGLWFCRLCWAKWQPPSASLPPSLALCVAQSMSSPDLVPPASYFSCSYLPAVLNPHALGMAQQLSHSRQVANLAYMPESYFSRALSYTSAVTLQPAMHAGSVFHTPQSIINTAESHCLALPQREHPETSSATLLELEMLKKALEPEPPRTLEVMPTDSQGLMEPTVRVGHQEICPEVDAVPNSSLDVKDLLVELPSRAAKGSLASRFLRGCLPFDCATYLSSWRA